MKIREVIARFYINGKYQYITLRFTDEHGYEKTKPECFCVIDGEGFFPIGLDVKFLR